MIKLPATVNSGFIEKTVSALPGFIRKAFSNSGNVFPPEYTRYSDRVVLWANDADKRRQISLSRHYGFCDADDVWLLVMILGPLGVIAVMSFRMELQTYLLIPAAAGFLLWIWKQRNYQAIENKIRSLEWPQCFQKAVSKAESKGCLLPPELRAFQSVVKTSIASSFRMSSPDILGMVRLSEMLMLHAESSASPGLRIRLSGESSELLNRVADKLTGENLRKLTEPPDTREEKII